MDVVRRLVMRDSRWVDGLWPTICPVIREAASGREHPLLRQLPNRSTLCGPVGPPDRGLVDVDSGGFEGLVLIGRERLGVETPAVIHVAALAALR